MSKNGSKKYLLPNHIVNKREDWCHLPSVSAVSNVIMGKRQKEQQDLGGSLHLETVEFAFSGVTFLLKRGKFRSFTELRRVTVM